MNSKILRVPLVIVLITVLVMAVSPALAAQVNLSVQKDLEDSLVCQDGCGMILSSCDNQTAQYMRKIITDDLAKGMSKDQIIGYFVNIYGVKVMAAPPAKGFNITAWVTPFIAIIAGALVIYFVLDKWVLYAKLEKMDKEETDTGNSIDLSEYENKLDEELKKYL